MKVAIEGCCHGELDAIYASIAKIEESKGFKVDVLLVCGDFQAMRSPPDLHTLACPAKYRALGTFHPYYSGAKKAPILTIVIGGNHESSGYMWELYHGGFLAPNIYYLGNAGSVLLNGVKISGISGIFNRRHYQSGHFEKVPYDDATIRSVYHIREYDVYRIAQLAKTPPDIFLSHDWPLGIEQHGDVGRLIREKPFFKDEIQRNELGSPPLNHLLKVLRPRYWFAAHLHVKFAAVYKHNGTNTVVKRNQPPGPAWKAKEEKVNNVDEIKIDEDDDEDMEVRAGLIPGDSVVNGGRTGVGHVNDDEIKIDDDDDILLQNETKEAVSAIKSLPVPGPEVDESVAQFESKAEANENPDEIVLDDFEAEEGIVKPPSAPVHEPERTEESRVTKFLALSKCLPGRDFLQIIDYPLPGEDASSSSDSITPSSPRMTFDPEWLAVTRALHPYLSLAHHQTRLPPNSTELITRELEWVKRNVGTSGDGILDVEEVQKFVKTAPGVGDEGGDSVHPSTWYTNPQTEAFCQMLGIELKINPPPPNFISPQAADAGLGESGR